jgi:transcriptional regulator with XRE-family HTH domain
MSSGQDKADRLKTRHIDVALGQRVRAIREAMGLTRKQVAQNLAVSETRVQNYEDGERISASRLWQFCGLYGVEVESLFEGLPHHVGNQVLHLAEEGAEFDNPLADDVVRAIGTAAADLNPIERRMALAALRGMGSRKLKVP